MVMRTIAGTLLIRKQQRGDPGIFVVAPVISVALRASAPYIPAKGRTALRENCAEKDLKGDNSCNEMYLRARCLPG